MTKISSTLITACVAFATLSSGLPHKNQPRQNEVLDPSFSAPKFNLTAIESFVGDIERPPTVDPDPSHLTHVKPRPFNFNHLRRSQLPDTLKRKKPAPFNFDGGEHFKRDLEGKKPPPFSFDGGKHIKRNNPSNHMRKKPRPFDYSGEFSKRQAPPAKPTKSTPFNFSDRRHNKRDDWQYSCWKKQSGSLSLAWASAYTWAANQTLYEQGNCELPSDKKCVDCKCATNAAIQLCRGNEQTTNAISVPKYVVGSQGAQVIRLLLADLLGSQPCGNSGCTDDKCQYEGWAGRGPGGFSTDWYIHLGPSAQCPI